MHPRLAIVLFVVTAACSSKPAAPPDPQAYRAMTDEQKCAAVAPRALPCVDELMITILHAVTGDRASDPEFARKIDDEIRANRSDGDLAKTMHQSNCNGDLHYTDSVIACWSVEGCQPFAECVSRTAAKPAHR